MKITKMAIPYIYPARLCAGALIVGALILSGCADTGGSTRNPAGGQETADNQQKAACKAAIDDVTRFCSGDKASTGKCNDAKAKTRELCIDSN